MPPAHGPIRLSTLALAAALAWLAWAPAGCMVIQTGPSARSLDAGAGVATSGEDHGEEIAGGAWPERWGRRGARPKGVIEPVDIPFRELVGVRLGEHHQLRPAEEERGAVERLARGEPGVGLYRYRAEGPGSYVFIKSFQTRDATGAEPEPSPERWCG